MKYHNSFLVIPLFLFSASAMSAVTPKITKISVTPTSAPAGTMFKFTAELDNLLPTGYKLKIDTNGKNSYIVMTGAGTSYSLSRTFYTAGRFTYKVVIKNAKNISQGGAKVGSYNVTSAVPENHAPTLSLINAENTATTNTAYTVTFNAKDIDANLSSITMNWGDNSEPETLTATDSKDLTFSHMYTSASSFGWNAFASDKGSPVLNSKAISKIVTVSNVSNPEPVEIIAPPAKTTGYTKIANDGSELPDSATLGTNPKDWACTKDNDTGLIWEVKTDDEGLRDYRWKYTWYEPDTSKNGGFEGHKNDPDAPSYCKTNECNTYAYAKSVNEKGLCGSQDWRMPTHEELSTLVYCSDGEYNSLNQEKKGFKYICEGNAHGRRTTYIPTINSAYFPDTQVIIATHHQPMYWSSSTRSVNGFDAVEYDAKLINFYMSDFYSNSKRNDLYVRLVR